jgi:hypothetical protein
VDSFDELQVHMLTVHYEDSAVAQAIDAMDTSQPSESKPAEE